MHGNEYQAAAMRTATIYDKDRTFSGNHLVLLNAALGVAGECGEIVDHIKKALFHGHDLHIDAIEGELGDILWYVALFAHACNLSLDAIMARNVAKLKARYPNGFSEQASRDRVDTPASVCWHCRDEAMIDHVCRSCGVLDYPIPIDGSIDYTY